MMATAVEAIIGAVFKDSGFDLEAVRAVMARFGFFSHHLLTTTNCDSLVRGTPNRQLRDNWLTSSPSSFHWDDICKGEEKPLRLGTGLSLDALENVAFDYE
jgi:hypothetical protein